MTSNRAILLSALIVALAIIGAAWWIVAHQSPPERYHLINVGKGETQRIDRTSGTVTRCRYGRCEELTDGAKVIDKPDDWEKAGFRKVTPTSAP